MLEEPPVSTYLFDNAILLRSSLLFRDASRLHRFGSSRFCQRLLSLGLSGALDGRGGIDRLEDARTRVACGRPCTFAGHFGHDFGMIGQRELHDKLEYHVI